MEALEQMPSYAKFMKDILAKKRMLGEFETVALTEESSAIFQNKLPPKLMTQAASQFHALSATAIVARPFVTLVRV